MRGELKIHDAKSLIEKFKLLQYGEMDKILTAALRKAAVPIRAELRRIAPKDTGTLQASIKIGKVTRGKTNKDTGTRSFSIAITAGKGNSTDMFKGDTYYLGFLEFGTNVRYHKSGKSVGRVAAKNFMQQAFNYAEDEAAAILETEISDGIDRIIANR